MSKGKVRPLSICGYVDCPSNKGFHWLDTECMPCRDKWTQICAELDRLRSLATRWYLADGTFEVLPEEEVIRRRKEAAKTLKKCGDVEGMAKVIDDTWDKYGDDKGPASVHAASAISARLLKGDK